MAKEVLVIREAGKKMPEAFMQKVLEECPTCFGYASPHNGTIHREVIASDEADLLGTLKNVEDTYASDTVYYFFANYEGDQDISFNAFQPIKLIADAEGTDKEVIHFAAIAAGDFSNYSEGDPTYTNSFRVIHECFLPKIGEYMELPGGTEMNLLATMCDKAPFRKHVMEAMEPHGNVILIPAKGKAVAFAKQGSAKDVGSWDWGWSSDALGFSNAPDTVVGKAEEAGPGKVLTKREKAALAAAAGDTGPVPDPQAGLKEKFKNVLKADGWSIQNSMLWCKPNKGSKYHDARAWWNNNCIEPAPKGDSNENVQKLMGGFSADKLKPNSAMKAFFDKATGVEKAEEPKKADALEAPVETHEPSKKDVDVSLFIPGKQKENFVKMMEAGVFKAADLDTLKNYAKGTPSATEQLGITVDEFKMFHPNSVMRFVHNVGAHAAICMICELNKTLLGISAEEKKPTEPEKKVEVVSGVNPATGKRTLSLPRKIA